MDLYAALEAIVRQIPRGRFAFASDVAEALGDRAVAVALPYCLRKILPMCKGAGRVVRADGSSIIEGNLSQPWREGLAVAESRMVNAEDRVFRGFRTRHPLCELRQSQIRMSRCVAFKDEVRKPEIVAGVDVSYVGDHAYAAAVAMRMKTLAIISSATVEMDVDFPYVPGYLAYREYPPMIKALRALRARPQLVLVDGHGVLHPARFGVACHIGLRMSVPTIGVGKSHLVGEFDSMELEDGRAAPVSLGGRVLGYALRTSRSVKPIFVSPGNMIGPRTAARIAKGLCLSRIPEPIRLADSIAREKKKEKSRLKEVLSCDRVKS